MKTHSINKRFQIFKYLKILMFACFSMLVFAQVANANTEDLKPTSQSSQTVVNEDHKQKNDKLQFDVVDSNASFNTIKNQIDSSVSEEMRTTLFSPEAEKTDVLINEILVRYFGYDNSDDGDDVASEFRFESMNQVFLTAILFLGIILVIVNVVLSMVHQASSGEILDVKNKLMNLFRFGVGFSAVLPIGKMQLAAVQTFIIWLAAQSILVSDSLWETYLNETGAGNQHFQTRFSSQLKKSYVKKFEHALLNQVCYESLRDQSFKNDPAEKDKYGISVVKDGDLNVVNFGIEEDTFFSVTKQPYCGKFILSEKSRVSNLDTVVNDINQINVDTKVKSTADVIEGVRRRKARIKAVYSCNQSSNGRLMCTDAELESRIKAFMKEDVESDENRMGGNAKEMIETAVENMVDNLNTIKSKEDIVLLRTTSKLAKDILNNVLNNTELKTDPNDLIRTKISVALDKYLTQVTNKYISAIRDINLSEIEKATGQDLRKMGIAGAGSYFLTLANYEAEFTEGIREVEKNGVLGTTLGGRESEDGKKMADLPFGGAVLHNVSFVKKALGHATADVNVGVGAKTKNGKNGAVDLSGGDPSDKGGKISEMIGSAMESAGAEDVLASAPYRLMNDSNLKADNLIFADNANEKHPILILKQYGDVFVNMIISFNLIMVGVLVASGISGSFFGIGAALNLAPAVLALFPTLMAILFGGLLSAAMLSFYLPLMPFVLWIGAVLGWVVLLVEAVIGAPLWMITFFIPTEKGFLGSQKQGLMLVVSMFSRLILMTWGIVLAYELCRPIYNITNFLFGYVESSISDTNMGLLFLVNWFAMFIAYVFVMTKTIESVFGLIHTIPDKLIAWIGGGADKALGAYSEKLETNSNAAIAGAYGLGKTLSDAASPTNLKSAASTFKDNKIKGQANAMESDLSRLQKAAEKDQGGNKGSFGGGESNTLQSGFNDVRAKASELEQDPSFSDEEKDGLSEIQKTSSEMSGKLAEAKLHKGVGQKFSETTPEVAQELGKRGHSKLSGEAKSAVNSLARKYAPGIMNREEALNKVVEVMNARGFHPDSKELEGLGRGEINASNCDTLNELGGFLKDDATQTETDAEYVLHDLQEKLEKYKY